LDEDSPLDAQDLLPPEPPPIILGEGLGLELGVVAGDLVHLVLAAPELGVMGPGPRVRALRVAGVFRTGVHEYDQTWAVVSLEDAIGSIAPGLAGGVEIVLRDPMRSADVARRLSAMLGGSFQVSEWTTQFSRLFAAFRWERLIMALALGLIGLVAGFNIFTILSMNVMARTSDIAILAALGARSHSIVRIFAWMGLLLGCAGTLTGLLLGSVAAVVVDRHHLVALDPDVYLVSHVPFRVEPLDLVAVALGMFVVSAVSTVLPTRAVARLDPVEALRAA
jgi:lipoprotein-releasing system permease protein